MASRTDLSRTTDPAASAPTAPQGLTISRRFTTPGVHPYDEVPWELRTSAITDERGEVVFEQRDVEIPKPWSQTATNVVVSKYFRGPLGTPQRERSVKQLLDRVANTVSGWGIKDGYFASTEEAETFRAELTALLLTQRAAFNSPVWFNVGIEPHPQCSACQPYHALVNTMQGPMPIGDIVTKNLIGLPVYDGDGLTQVVAVKHNGRKPVYRVVLNDGFSIEATPDHLVCAHATRRTQRLEWRRVEELRPGVVMRVYPHAAETVTPTAPAKAVAEAALAGWLQADGFAGQYAKGTNQSLTLEFMTVDDQEFAWVMQHLDVVFPGHHSNVTDVPTDDRSLRCRRIRLYGEPLRPFVNRYGLLRRKTDLRVPEPIWTAPNEAASAYLKSLFQSDGYAAVHVPSAHVAFAVISRAWAEGVQRLMTRFGIYTRLREKSERRQNRHDMYEVDLSIRSERDRFCRHIGFISERKNTKLRQSLALSGKACPDIRYSEIVAIEPLGEMDVYDIQTVSGQYLTNSVLVHNCFILSVKDTMESILDWYRVEGMIFKYGSGSGINLSPIRSSQEQLAGGGTASGPVSFMRAADASAGVIKSGGKTRRAAKMVVLNADHPDIKKFILCKWQEEKKAWALVDAGFGASIDGEAYGSVFFQNANNSVRVTDAFMQAVLSDGDWTLKAARDGAVVETVKARELLQLIAEATWHCGDPGMQFDTTINHWHTCPATGRINASNPCSEYMHLDDSACNLASLNLMRFMDEAGTFRVEEFRHAVRIMTIAQDIIVDNSSYPTPKITENAKAYRQLGLGYANLGALLMSLGIPYDSDAGRAYAAVITALMCGEAYRTSALIAQSLGPYAGFAKNREPQLRVIQQHRDALQSVDQSLVPELLYRAAGEAWGEALRLGDAVGVRNAQLTVLAPTGCVTGNSLVVTDRGLMRLNRLGNPRGAQWQEASFRVATDEGPRQATKFYINGRAMTRRIRTEAGYEIQGTPNHRVKVVDPVTGGHVWRCLDELQAGDVVPIAMSSLIGTPRAVALPPLSEPYWASDPEVRAPRAVTLELAELIGYFMGDGSLHSKGLRFCVTEGDADVVERLRSLSQTLFHLTPHVTPQKGYLEVAIHSVALAMWWDACGFAKRDPDGVPDGSHTGKGYQPQIPDALLATNDPAAYRAFLRGLFEADGTAIEGVPAFCTAHAGFAQELMVLLLALGFPMTRKIGQSEWGGESFVARVRNAGYNRRFLDEIGFIGRRKWSRIIPLSGPWSGKRDYVHVAPVVVEELVPAASPHRNAVLLSVRRYGGIPRQRAVALLEESHDERLAHALRFFYDRVEVAEDGGEVSTYDLSVPENVTYLANGFISHNTIGFMLDCDTTGIEPDIALIKYKRLVGGGLLKIVNQTVPRALARLGYSETQADEICRHLDAQETIEGAPHLKPEHLAVFDCAFKAVHGTRSIQPMGHVRMMGAVQPFISGAISKCVTGDTLVPTCKGLVPIASFYNEERPDTFKPLELDVASLDGIRPTNQFYCGGMRDVIRAELRDGRRITATPNHRLYVASPEGLCWKRMDELEAGDHVAIKLGDRLWAAEDADLRSFVPSTPRGNQKVIQVPARMTPGLAWLLGAYTAEGNVTESNWTVAMHNNSPEVQQKIARIVRHLFGIDPHVRQERTVVTCRISSKTVVEFFRFCGVGEGAARKVVPWCVLQSTEACVRAFISGVYRDGYIPQHASKVGFCVASQPLVDQLQAVLSNFGILSAQIRKHNTELQKDSIELNAFGQHAQAFVRAFEFDEPQKRLRARQLLGRTFAHSWADVVPCFDSRMAFVGAPRSATARYEHQAYGNPNTIAWDTLKRLVEDPDVPTTDEMAVIIRNNIHFVPVRQVTSGLRELVYDFSVPDVHAFVGNGIVNHNTVNVPAEATVDDIMQAYLESWRMGVKAIAIYRDGSKRVQPLSTSGREEATAGEAPEKIVYRPVRHYLPDERQAITHKFSIAGHDGYVTVGLFEDGTPGEIFIVMSKEGTVISGLLDAFATAISLALQYGVPLEALVKKYSHMRFEPAGITANPQIRFASSILDYVFRWMALKFLPPEKQPATDAPSLVEGSSGPKPSVQTVSVSEVQERQAFQGQVDAPPCPDCGSMMVRSGNCYKCFNCGSTSGCS